jgi:hypothetical protein
VARVLLEHGVTPRGTGAIHAATCASILDPTHFEVLDLLSRYGGNIDEMEMDPKARRPPRQRTSFAGTALHRAIWIEKLDTVRYILERGASRTIPSWSGRSALCEAEKRSSKTETVDLMVNEPVDDFVRPACDADRDDRAKIDDLIINWPESDDGDSTIKEEKSNGQGLWNLD